MPLSTDPMSAGQYQGHDPLATRESEPGFVIQIDEHAHREVV